MPKPITLKHLIKVLQAKGFVFISQKGSHAKYKTIGDPSKIVIVAMSKKEIPYGTFKSILLHSGLEE
ncbi:MAG: type II toxin-antitoxin system HicA family toxin, partial [bacterium]